MRVEGKCSYGKWERRIKGVMELKDVAYVLEDDFNLPTKSEQMEISQMIKVSRTNMKAIATVDIANDLICDMSFARELQKFLDDEFKGLRLRPSD
jgi:hypothetical protein